MKLRYLCVAVTAAFLGLTGCQPDEYSLGGSIYTPDDLQQGINYSVVPDKDNPNIIHLSSNVKGVIPSWILTDGSTSQKASLDLNIPFAGEYSVTFGVTTEAGVIYGEPYKFTIATSDFTMVESNALWGYLAGGTGKTKRWVPVDKDYGVGQCTAPMMYCNPDDVLNDGSNSTNLAFEGFKPNWDPGFQDWLITATDPYMDSFMEFGLDETDGCTIRMVRGSESTDTLKGTFSLSLDDASHPTISFNGGTNSLHFKSFDEVCANYTQAIQIVELTPYILQLATERTNSDGKWWLIWNFIAEDVKLGKVEIPVEEKPVVAEEVVPVDDLDLANSLFTVENDGVSYLASSVTYNMSEDQPYGFFWWNGGAKAWEASNAADYGAKNWYPEATNNIGDFELVIKRVDANGNPYKDGDGNRVFLYSDENAGVADTFTIAGNVLKFKYPIEFITADSVTISTDEITVVKADASNNEFYFAVEVEKNSKGAVSKYAFANLTQKSIGGGTTGPVDVKVDQAKVDWGFGDTGGKALRIILYNSWGGTEAVDPAKIKLKKGKTMKVSFKITSGLTWKDGAAPKAILRHNVDGLGVSNDWYGFSDDDAVAINKDGVTTISLTNNTGSAADFSNGGGGGSLQVVVQLDSKNEVGNDLCDITLDEDGDPAITGEVSVTIE